MQASLLAQHDNRSPCIIVAASSVFSLICDVTLIVYFRLGLTGAAASTVVTQYLGLAAFIHASMLPGRLMPTIPEVRLPQMSVPKVPKMIPKLPWTLVTTSATSSSATVPDQHGKDDAGGAAHSLPRFAVMRRSCRSSTACSDAVCYEECYD